MKHAASLFELVQSAIFSPRGQKKVLLNPSFLTFSVSKKAFDPLKCAQLRISPLTRLGQCISGGVGTTGGGGWGQDCVATKEDRRYIFLRRKLYAGSLYNDILSQ